MFRRHIRHERTDPFLGLGTLGLPMATNLLESGYALTVYNRSASKADPLVQRGARLASSPAEALTSGIVISVLWDATVTEQIVAGEGFLDRLGPGGIHISMCTGSPDAARRLAALHTRHGSILVEAPVFGRAEAAVARALSIPFAGHRPPETASAPYSPPSAASTSSTSASRSAPPPSSSSSATSSSPPPRPPCSNPSPWPKRPASIPSRSSTCSPTPFSPRRSTRTTARASQQRRHPSRRQPSPSKTWACLKPWPNRSISPHPSPPLCSSRYEQPRLTTRRLNRSLTLAAGPYPIDARFTRNRCPSHVRTGSSYSFRQAQAIASATTSSSPPNTAPIAAGTLSRVTHAVYQ